MVVMLLNDHFLEGLNLKVVSIKKNFVEPKIG